MHKNLVIVESPAKAKTIEGYLGKDFKVVSSYGHVRDLKKGNNAIDIEGGFMPTYEVSSDKKEVIKELKKLSKEAELIYLASDDDREGEAISWHLKEALKLNDDNTKRIVFREITKKAILNAIEKPRAIDIDLVNAQQARRVLDRLVGFELSPILWKKIRTGLSAGRVQSVAVRLVVEKEREIEAFEAESFFRVSAIFIVAEGKAIKGELPIKFKKEDEAYEFVKLCKDASFKIDGLKKSPGKKSPTAPFTTSTLQQEASRKLGFSVSKTMMLAQRLYESGKITYMRTDSVNLSDEAIQKASAQITGNYGPEYLQVRKFKTKSEGAQEAHEAVRPTDFSSHTVDAEYDEKRLYELIWKKAISSQMSDAKIEKTTATIGVSTSDHQFNATGQVVTFDGFLKVYTESPDDDENTSEDTSKMLPPLQIGDELELSEMKSRESFSRPPARFTEASLVKKLEELGIGRPSTYAPTISTIQKRNYVIKESREGRERSYKEIVLSAKREIEVADKVEITGTEKGKLFPTNVGMVVTDFLVKNFPKVFEYSFTANVEKEFDEIAQGKLVWNGMLGDFYNEFHPKVEASENIERAEINSTRELGIDPASGEKIYVKLGRFGPYAQIGELVEGEEKPKYASLRKGQFIESITLEDALELFKLPRDVGMYEDKKIVAAIGRFGPYLRHDGKFVSLKKEYDPHTVDEATAIELIEAKRKADREKFIKDFEEDAEMQILNGRWGPYIKYGKKNVRLPKDLEDPKSLTYEQCKEIVEKAPEKKTKAKKKTTTKK
ncbi:type I DNA topoisomerase [Aureibacter tunicatorum]|uniref:DNA topoisomerase 1 n=1 Tax=Aureibacter tunicatorum TaxID=866807 RepID=A0AAE3XQ09_9BACT|nr:type I DNA topoisomerase [Aureibacter tunicatorum]MDR6239836.1 DNA topoisomerase-1 [Aureibacter tunicatorum]BDD04311.1 DNA topoisomerase 1 [Aureibacter tunicatorum]